MLSFKFILKIRLHIHRITAIIWIYAVSVIAVKIAVEICMSYQLVKLSISRAPLPYCIIPTKAYNDITPNTPVTSSGIRLPSFQNFGNISDYFINTCTHGKQHSAINLCILYWQVKGLVSYTRCIAYVYLTDICEVYNYWMLFWTSKTSLFLTNNKNYDPWKDR